MFVTLLNIYAFSEVVLKRQLKSCSIVNKMIKDVHNIKFINLTMLLFWGFLVYWVLK